MRPGDLEARVLDVDLGQRLVLARVVGRAIRLIEQGAHQLPIDDPHLPRMLAAELHGAHRVGLLAERDELLEGAADRVGAAEGAGRPQQREDLGRAALARQLPHRVPDPFDVRRGRRGHLRGAQAGHLGPVARGDRRDLLGVGRDDDLRRTRRRAAPRRSCRRSAGVPPSTRTFLSRNALRSGAGGDQGYGGGSHRLRPARGRGSRRPSSSPSRRRAPRCRPRASRCRTVPARRRACAARIRRSAR